LTDPTAPGLPVDRDGYRYVPLRRVDIEPLRQFRNEQIDVLRQAEPISPEQQERWFEEAVVPTQEDPQPPQLLVSILDEHEGFVGYGGLTNIDWRSRRAEISFLLDPERAGDEEVYRRDTASFLAFLADWAFGELGLNRLFAESYAFRQFHIGLLEEAGYRLEGRLREHVLVRDGLEDSVVHGLLAAEWRAR
jgi:RimJ/RimL family protein N-acetyltransferase